MGSPMILRGDSSMMFAWPKMEYKVLMVSAEGNYAYGDNELNEVLADGWNIVNRSAAPAGKYAIFMYELARAIKEPTDG